MGQTAQYASGRPAFLNWLPRTLKKNLKIAVKLFGFSIEGAIRRQDAPERDPLSRKNEAKDRFHADKARYRIRRELIRGREIAGVAKL